MSILGYGLCLCMKNLLFHVKVNCNKSSDVILFLLSYFELILKL